MPSEAKRYSTYLPPAREKQMETLINKIGEKPSAIVRDALVEYLDKKIPTVVTAATKIK